MHPLLSIIIPAYNEERNIRQCLDSVLRSQGQRSDVEIIIIDDCSTDNTLEILYAHKRKHEQIKVLSNSFNIGLGLSRNKGIRVAAGEYILFVDSDDWLHEMAIDEICATLMRTSPELIVFGHTNFYSNNEFLDCRIKHPAGTGATYPFRLDEKHYSIVRSFHVAWNKVYRRQWIIQLKLEFPKGNYEDLSFTYIALMEATLVSIIEKPLYIYRQHPETKIGRPNKKTNNVNHSDVFDRYEVVFAHISKNSELAIIGKYIYAKMLNQYVSIYCERLTVSSDQRHLFEKKMHRHLMKFCPKIRHRFSFRDDVVYWSLKWKIFAIIRIIFSVNSELRSLLRVFTKNSGS